MQDEVRAALGWLSPNSTIEVEDPEDAVPLVNVRPETIDLVRADRRPAVFDYQADLANSILSSVAAGTKGLLSLPTGAGKTRTAISAFLKRLEVRPDARWIWIAPSLELLSQARSSVESMWFESATAPDVRLQFRGSSGDGASLWLTTPQSVNAGDAHSLVGYEALIFDEAHQLGAPTFRSAATHAEHAGAVLIGLSATPGRARLGETEELVTYFDERLLTSRILGSHPVETLQSRGVLSRIRFKFIGKGCETWRADRRLRAMAWLAEKLASDGRRTLVFAPSVPQARALDAFLRSRGMESVMVDGQLSEVERTARIRQFADGRARVLVNNKLLATGYDCPAVTDVVLGMRVGSPILFEQMVGRAARGPLTGGSPVARVWQFDDHLALHGLPSSYYRFSEFDWSIV